MSKTKPLIQEEHLKKCHYRKFSQKKKEICIKKEVNSQKNSEARDAEATLGSFY